MTEVVSTVLTGLSSGSIYALIALGMVLAFRATDTFNFAHGELMLVPAFVVGAGLPWSDNVGVTLPIALLLAGAIGVAFYLLVLRRTKGFMSTIATLGLAGALDGIIQIIWGTRQVNIKIPGMPTGVATIFGARVATADLTRTGLALLLVVLITSFLRFTSLGLHVRMGGQDPLLASQSGVNVRAVHVISWAAAAVLAGVAGIAYGSTTVVDNTVVTFALTAAPAIIIGGLDSIPGAIVGGILVGIWQACIATIWSPQYVQVGTYLLLFVFIIWLPYGLFGTRQIERV